ncbi:ATP-binding protein [Flavobacterium sp. JP2137]|uniref:Dph6-related ATP pyrophosphatase n=1 Tax=Flavobacterium sp. JP2137 TaxID=3414510 RepID=UPI003D2FFE2A
MKKALLHWSTGKDAAYALHQLQQSGQYDILRLSTSVQLEYDRVSMHGIRRELLLRQVAALKTSLPLDLLELPFPLSHETYDALMLEQCLHYKEQGIYHHVFGDILLADLKDFRERQLSKLGLTAVFPLWNRPTDQLLLEMISAGFKAVVICVNETQLGREFLGRTLDEQFLKDLPKGVDPCGENGEFHTFVYDGPLFEKPVAFQVGEAVYKTYDAPKTTADAQAKKIGFWFLDLL